MSEDAKVVPGDFFFVVDYREKRSNLISVLQSETHNREMCAVVVANLMVGDVWLCRALLDTEDRGDRCVAIGEAINEAATADRRVLQEYLGCKIEVLVVVERKGAYYNYNGTLTGHDLVNSQFATTDDGVNHWQDQLMRMQVFCDTVGAKPCGVFEGYFMEAAQNHSIGKMPSDMWGKMMSRAALVHGWTTVPTNCVEDTVRYLSFMMHDLKKNDARASGWVRLGNGTFDLDASFKKSDNSDPEVWYRKLLVLLPRYTDDVARSIMDLYPSLPDLLDAALMRPYAALLKSIKSIELTRGKKTKTGKWRKLGEARAKMLIGHLRYGREGPGV
jgi:hypothetical protein